MDLPLNEPLENLIFHTDTFLDVAEKDHVPKDIVLFVSSPIY